MIVVRGLLQPLKATGKRVSSWVEDGDKLVVKADSTVRRAACPRCLKRSSRLHGHYRRVVADSLPFGRPVTLVVEIRRFRCINGCSAQCTFSECIKPMAVACQRRTLHLMRGCGRSAGGNRACRSAAPRCCMSRAGCLPTPTPVVIGIDDWVLACGHRYGTIAVDLQRHCPIELLAGRDAPTVVSWLKQPPGIEVIARDRASACAGAAHTAAFDAQQVADRWRLLTFARQPARCRRAGAAALSRQDERGSPPGQRGAAATSVRVHEVVCVSTASDVVVKSEQ